MVNKIEINDMFSINKVTSILLKPFTWLYGLIQNIRNSLYDNLIIPSDPTPQFSIVVGNLTVGGTGKTPMVEYLIQQLNQKYQIVTLSRGYGRKSRGFLVASSLTTAEDIGDEPLQYYEKFSDICHVAVSENRIRGSRTLQSLFPNHQILLLDDAFQHRALRPDLSLLLNDFNRPFYQDSPFPGGRLRENRTGAARADAIITTKCPDYLSEAAKLAIRKEIGRYALPGTPCFFSKVKYGTLRSFDNTEITARSVTLVAGVAQPAPFIEYVKRTYQLNHIRVFPDHHTYTHRDLEEILNLAGKDDLLITTEKDKVKLRPLAQDADALAKFGYIPIQIDFGNDTARFNEWLDAHVNEKGTPEGI